MRQSTAWLVQAKSDLTTADHLAGQLTDTAAYCQVAAKTQQAVEKSVKALQTILHHAGLHGKPVNSGHQVAKIASGIRSAAPLWPKNLSGLKKVVDVLSDARLETMKELDAIVPQYPAPGQLPRRNTEYPFQESAGLDTWHAPGEVDTFTKGEVKRFLACARQVQVMTDKLVTALELAFP